MIVELKRARQLIETCGWVGPAREPMCLASNGHACQEGYEGVATFSVSGALIATGGYPEGWNAIEAVVAPGLAAVDRFNVDAARATVEQLGEFRRLCRAAVSELTLQAWLQVAERTREDVLRVFVRAIERSKKLGERR